MSQENTVTETPKPDTYERHIRWLNQAAKWIRNGYELHNEEAARCLEEAAQAIKALIAERK